MNLDEYRKIAEHLLSKGKHPYGYYLTPSGLKISHYGILTYIKSNDEERNIKNAMLDDKLILIAIEGITGLGDICWITPHQLHLTS